MTLDDETKARIKAEDDYRVQLAEERRIERANSVDRQLLGWVGFAVLAAIFVLFFLM